jgi:hypothetical protein
VSKLTFCAKTENLPLTGRYSIAGYPKKERMFICNNKVRIYRILKIAQRMKAVICQAKIPGLI